MIVFLDQVLVEFRNIGRDIGLGASLADQIVHFSAEIKADNTKVAIATLMDSIQTALDAAGSHPSEWPTFTAEAILFQCE